MPVVPSPLLRACGLTRATPRRRARSRGHGHGPLCGTLDAIISIVVGSSFGSFAMGHPQLTSAVSRPHATQLHISELKLDSGSGLNLN